MSRVLVVGGNGYIGSHLKKRFPDFIYTGTKEFDLKEKNKILNYCQDIDIDVCIILSATISYKKDVDFSSAPFTTNVIGLNNLLSVLEDKNKDMKIIYFSSMTVYADTNTLPVTENSCLDPLHTYGLSKVYAESLVKYYGFKSVVIRIPGIYGGDRKNGLIYNVINKMLNNIDIDIDTKNLGYWETLHIDDMISMFSDFLENYTYDKKFEIFNIAYGEKTDIIETVDFIHKKLKSKSKINIIKEYKDLYLSNEKIKNFVHVPITYRNRLSLYISEIR